MGRILSGEWKKGRTDVAPVGRILSGAWKTQPRQTTQPVQETPKDVGFFERVGQVFRGERKTLFGETDEEKKRKEEEAKRKSESLGFIGPVRPKEEGGTTFEQNILAEREGRKPLPALDFIDKLQEVKDDPVQLAPFAGDAVELVRLGELGITAQKLLSGEKIDEEQLEDLNEYVERAQRDTTWGYKVADVISEAIPFATELYLTRGLYTVPQKAALKTAKNTLKKLLTKEGVKLLEKRLVKMGLKTASVVAGATTQAAATGVIKVPARTVEKQLQATLAGDEESVYTSAIKAFGEHWVETVSERSGGLFGDIAKPFRGSLVKLGLIKAASKANPTKSVSKVRKIVNSLGYHGVIEEMLEERIAEVGHGLLNKAGLSDQEFSIPSLEQLSVELAAFSVPGVASKLAQDAARTFDSKNVLPEQKKVVLPQAKEKPPILKKAEEAEAVEERPPLPEREFEPTTQVPVVPQTAKKKGAIVETARKKVDLTEREVGQLEEERMSLVQALEAPSFVGDEVAGAFEMYRKYTEYARRRGNNLPDFAQLQKRNPKLASQIDTASKDIDDGLTGDELMERFNNELDTKESIKGRLKSIRRTLAKAKVEAVQARKEVRKEAKKLALPKKKKPLPAAKKPITKQVKKKEVKPVVKDIKKPVTKEPKKAKISKVAKSIRAKALQKGFTDVFSELAGFTPVKIATQASKIADMIDKDIETVKKIVRGTIDLPQDVNGTLLSSAVEEYALEKGDMELLQDLAKSSLVAETSTAAQTLRLVQERDPDSVIKQIKEIQKARKEGAELNKKGGGQEKVEADIKKQAKASIKKVNKKYDWNNLIDEITC